MHEVPTFVDEHLLRVGELEFHCDLYVGKAPSGRFPVMKPRPLVERYIELAGELRPKTIVELGIRLGGSTVLMSELFHPDTLVALGARRGTGPCTGDLHRRPHRRRLRQALLRRQPG